MKQAEKDIEANPANKKKTKDAYNAAVHLAKRTRLFYTEFELLRFSFSSAKIFFDINPQARTAAATPSSAPPSDAPEATGSSTAPPAPPPPPQP